MTYKNYYNNNTNQYFKPEKKVSCGVLILNEYKEILLCHVTGQEYFDIPKGVKELYESEINAAIRETYEETGLEFQKTQIKEIGFFENYIPNKKDLCLFYVRVKKQDVVMNDLKCTSFFTLDNGDKVKEVDSYEWVDITKILDFVNVRLQSLIVKNDLDYRLISL